MDNSNISNILYFYDDNCLGCKITSPRIARLEESVKVVKINGNKDIAAAEKYNIDFFPTIIILDKNNNILKKEIGPNKIQIFISNFLYN